MSLKKRAVSGVIIAGSLVMMCATADAADTVMGEKVMQTAETDAKLATDGTAGVVVLLNQVKTDALSSLDEAEISVEQTQTNLVASAEDSKMRDDEAAEAVVLETVPEDAAEETFEVQSITDETANETTIETAEDTETTETAADNTVEDVWENRLMADVDEFLYVRASGDADAEIVGKLYKGAVAEVVEESDGWTHIKSGNVEGYVNDDYCVTGENAYDYAVQNVETEAEIQTDGLRVRSEADENSKILTAVSSGTTFKVDTDAETTDEWVAVKYGDGTAYVSAEYVSTDLALGEAVTIEEEKAALAKKAAEEAKSAQVQGTETVQKSSVAASVDEVTLLAALIQCEAGRESYEGKLAVGAVVMNRVRSGSYPGSISGVINAPSQFPPATNGKVAAVIANGPSASCVEAAQAAIDGATNVGGATHFRAASSGQAGVVIGNHVFW